MFRHERQVRTDLVDLQDKLAKWIKRYNTQHNIKIKYLIVPEKDAKGAWHFHGLLSGLPFDHLEEVDFFQNRVIFNWLEYAAEFGYARVEEINELKCVVTYLLKQAFPVR